MHLQQRLRKRRIAAKIDDAPRDIGNEQLVDGKCNGAPAPAVTHRDSAVGEAFEEVVQHQSGSQHVRPLAVVCCTPRESPWTRICPGGSPAAIAAAQV